MTTKFNEVLQDLHKVNPALPSFTEAASEQDMWLSVQQIALLLGYGQNSDEMAQFCAYVISDGKNGNLPDDYALRVGALRPHLKEQKPYLIIHKHGHEQDICILHSDQDPFKTELQDIVDACELDYEPLKSEHIEVLDVSLLNSFTL